VEVATRFEGAFAIAVLMRCLAVFGTVAFTLLLIASSGFCYWRRESNIVA
jgi:cbb3-type cytochrome oxidase subunit 3